MALPLWCSGCLYSLGSWIYFPVMLLKGLAHSPLFPKQKSTQTENYLGGTVATPELCLSPWQSLNATRIKKKQIQKSKYKSHLLLALKSFCVACHSWPGLLPRLQLLMILTLSDRALWAQISIPMLFSFGTDHSRMCRPSRFLGWGQNAYSVLEMEVK